VVGSQEEPDLRDVVVGISPRKKKRERARESIARSYTKSRFVQKKFDVMVVEDLGRIALGISRSRPEVNRSVE